MTATAPSSTWGQYLRPQMESSGSSSQGEPLSSSAHRALSREPGPWGALRGSTAIIKPVGKLGLVYRMRSAGDQSLSPLQRAPKRPSSTFGRQVLNAYFVQALGIKQGTKPTRVS